MTEENQPDPSENDSIDDIDNPPSEEPVSEKESSPPEENPEDSFLQAALEEAEEATVGGLTPTGKLKAAPLPDNPRPVRSPKRFTASLDTFMAEGDLKTESELAAEARPLIKPWMKFHKFVLVKTVDEVKALVDSAMVHGRCSLDLETEGFDNRIDYDVHGNPSTKHKIVGYCIGLKGVGYYIPVRHNYDSFVGQANPNVPVAGVDAEIKRMCLATQPILTEEGRAEDPHSSMKWVTPPRMILYFWNSKFDQEFLWPITGIDYWHPSSYEDGMLAAYALYTNDAIGLKGKALELLMIGERDAEGKLLTYKYEMIEFKELFPPGTKKSQMKIADIYPDEGSPLVMYGCSDGICTELLCEMNFKKWDFAIRPAGFKYKEVLTEVKTAEAVISDDVKFKKYEFCYALEKQTSQAVRLVERTRAKIDRKALTELLAEAQKELEIYTDRICTLAASKGFDDFNPGSTQQLGDFLFGSKGLDISPKPDKLEASKQYKTDSATLEKILEDHPDIEVISWVVKYRQIDKIIGTYLTGLINNCDVNDCLRFNFNQTGAISGRFTAPAGEPSHGFSGIPIQGIPAREDPKKPKVAHSLRKMFVAREGYTMVKIDYSAQELRIAANVSGEPLWIKEFLEGEGDLHTLTAQAFFGPHITAENKLERSKGKTANFALIYGGGTAAIQRATQCDQAEAARRKASFDKSVPVFAQWVKGQHKSCKKEGGVWTAFKTFVKLPDANIMAGQTDSNGKVVDEVMAKKIRAACERQSTNLPIQGSGAVVMKISLVRLRKVLDNKGWLKNGDDSVRMIMTVHDEIVYEVRHDRLMEVIPLLVSIMEQPSRTVKWKVPLVVDVTIGLDWKAEIKWDKIMSGAKPVPDWLKDYVRPGQEVAPDMPPPIKASSAPAHVLPHEVKTEDAPKPAKAVGSADKTPTASLPAGLTIVTFRVPSEYLTRHTINIAITAITASRPSEETKARLRLLDGQGNILIDPQDGVHVDPQKFATEMQDRNLWGGGDWEVEAL